MKVTTIMILITSLLSIEVLYNNNILDGGRNSGRALQQQITTHPKQQQYHHHYIILLQSVSYHLFLDDNRCTCATRFTGSFHSAFGAIVTKRMKKGIFFLIKKNHYFQNQTNNKRCVL